LTADNALVWLIEVGLLRREVDGQGITDSFRLTPLGRQLTESFRGKIWSSPTIADRLLNALTRIFRLPF
ncbi:MAG: Npun_F0494 family protein, partial [Cyanobacteria bacterium J06641_2]